MRGFKLYLSVFALLLVPVALAAVRGPVAADAGDARLKGLWSRHSPQKEGDPVRFHYFHDDGIGLYRYGRLGLNNTHSYTWTTTSESAAGGELKLTFKKTGAEASTAYRIEKDPDGTEVLLLAEDPYEPRPVRYRKVAPPVGSDDETGDPNDVGGAGHPFARMWMHQTRYATGGMGFHIYQLKEPALDGRGVGWFHTGDFDNWSTETLFYRLTGNTLELHFPLRGERHQSAIVVGESAGHRVIDLASDPRNFWQRQVYVDGGASFGVELLGEPTPLGALSP